MLLHASPACRSGRGRDTMSSGRDCFDSRRDAGKREKTQMFHLQWLRTRGVNRGKPGLPGGHGRRLALLGFLIAASLLETGCQSGPFSPPAALSAAPPASSRARSVMVATAVAVPKSWRMEDAFRVECPSERPVLRSSFPAPRSLPARSTPSNVPPPDSPQYLEPVPQATPGPAPVRRFGRSGARAAPAHRHQDQSRATKPFVPIPDRTVLVAITWPTR